MISHLLLAFCLAVALSACARSPAPGETLGETLGGTEWTLQRIETPEGTITPELEAEQPTLRFESDGIAGSDGCNRFSGTMQMQDDGALAVGPLASTKRACPPPFAAVSTALLAALGERTVRATRTGDELRVSSNETVLVYTRR